MEGVPNCHIIYNLMQEYMLNSSGNYICLVSIHLNEMLNGVSLNTVFLCHYSCGMVVCAKSLT